MSDTKQERAAYEDLAAAIIGRAYKDKDWDFLSEKNRIFACCCGILEQDTKNVIELIKRKKTEPAPKKGKKLYFDFQGRKLCLTEIAKLTGMKRATIYGRIAKGMSLDEALVKKEVQRVKYNNKEYTIRELSNMSGLKRDLIYLRLKYGWSVERAIETPVLR